MCSKCGVGGELSFYLVCSEVVRDDAGVDYLTRLYRYRGFNVWAYKVGKWQEGSGWEGKCDSPEGGEVARLEACCREMALVKAFRRVDDKVGE